MNNIRIVGDMCCGCESCFQLCPKKAIVMKDDECGFSYPSVNDSLCVNCGECVNHCPVVNYEQCLSEKSLTVSFASYSKSNKNLCLSSSGGIAYEMMCSAFSRGYRVFGVRYSNNYESTIFDEAISEEDLNQFRGTKYIQSSKNGVFAKIKKYLQAGEKVLYVGLPCEVAGLKEYVKKVDSNLVCVELICHGPTSKRVAKEYLEKLQKQYKSKIVDFTIRKKIYGWTPGCLYASFENGKTFTKLFDATEYGFAFRHLSRVSCYSCRFKNKHHPGDILIGDYWGASSEQDSWNKNGVSIVFLNTEKGDDFWKTIDTVEKFEVPYKNAIKDNSSIFKSRDIRIRNCYFNHFLKHDIFYARKKTETLKEMSIRHLRNVYYLFKKKINTDKDLT